MASLLGGDLVDRWNSTTAAYPDTSCLQDLFWAQARKTPSAVAIDDPGQALRLTYAEVDDLTDRLACVLFSRFGVRPDTVCAIFMERSAEFVLAYVAILKAGGAYMPLELVYPKGLLSRAIRQTQCPVVLTKSKFVERLPAVPAASSSTFAAFLLDGPASVPAAADLPPGSVYPIPQGGFDPRPHPENLAFVVMSSGTTGQPKAICQVHRSAVHSYHDRFERFPYCQVEDRVDDRVGAGVFFVWEMMRPLLRGATCTTIPNDVLFDPQACTQFILDHGITRILFTPSLLQLIMDSVAPAEVARRLAGLRMLWLCGEVVTTELAQSFTSILPDCELLNLYSISECHDATIGDLKRDLDPARKYATCGKNIPNVRVYVVKVEETGDPHRPHLQRLAPGEAGEVFVGGPVLAREYLEMPEKTASRFVANPFSRGDPYDVASQRLYRTGDMGRVLPGTGELEIIGRCDFMVKIRGYSVVLGAVESAVGKHPMLASAVAITEGDEGTDKRVVCYVVPKVWENPPSAANLRVFLKDHLPPYAVPSVFYILAALPVNDSAAGKLDRKKLPKADVAQRLPAFLDSDDPAFMRATARGATETSLLKIVAELLGTADGDLSVTDSFFDIGGHSLLATRLVARITESLAVEGLVLADVVAHPAVRDLATRVDALRQGGTAGGSGSQQIGAGSAIDLPSEAEMLDPSIYPAGTRKAKRLSRFRMCTVLLRPRTIFLTGCTGWLGAHILEKVLTTTADVTAVCLVRAADETRGFQRLLDTLRTHKLLDGVMTAMAQGSSRDEAAKVAADEELHSRIVVVCGDLSRPMLGLSPETFRQVATETDSILHCGAAVNLVKPYSALKRPNVLGTQEVLRLAVTNGLMKTKIKPVFYVSTNGVFPVAESAYDARKGASKTSIVCKEDVDLAGLHAHLDEGYGMTKWVAEKMCGIAEARGLPVHVMRPGNMAGSSVTGAQNQSDFVFLFVSAMLALGAAPTTDMGSDYAFDLTPVDFAASAAVFSILNPRKAVARRVHLQNPRPPLSLNEIVAGLREVGHAIEDVTRDVWLKKMRDHAAAERTKNSQSTSIMQRVEAGFESFEVYFRASNWLTYGCDSLVSMLEGSGLYCPEVDAKLLAKWFPCA